MGEFPNCDIKLCDLEVARVIQQGETITEWVGTLDYMGKYIYCNSSFFYIDIVKSESLTCSFLTLKYV